MEKQISTDNKPEIIILNYLSFHNERNTLNPGYQKKIRDGYAISKKMDAGIARFKCSYPFGYLENGLLKIGSRSIQEINSTIPLIEYSASMNTLQGLITRLNIDEVSDEKVTLAMIDKMSLDAHRLSRFFRLLFILDIVFFLGYKNSGTSNGDILSGFVLIKKFHI